jgi:hypothetical protein
MTQKFEIFPSYTNRDLNNLHTYKYCDDDDSCLMYMFKNGKNIYHELDLFNNIPKQLEQDKINNIFNTNNVIKTTLLNDTYISSIKNKYNIDTDLVINSILMHLRPILFSGAVIDETNIDSIKEKVDNTLNFELNYMNNIENQIEFLTSQSTTVHIKNKINNRIKDLNLEVKDDYIQKIMIHEVNNFRSRYGDSKNKISPVEVNNIYVNKLSKLKSRDIFSIINDVIERIVSNINIENNMITNNNKLDKWDTILGDHNKHGLRSYSNIKLNEKKPKGMLFNMTF